MEATTALPGKDRYVIEAVVKAMDVLLAFGRPPHAFTPAELARITGHSFNQVFRCLRSLAACGLVRLGSEGRYELTPLLVGLAAKAGPKPMSLVAAAQPVLDELVQAAQETVHLFALTDGFCVCVDYRTPQREGLIVSSSLGRRVPLHAGATPKAILAFLPNEKVVEVAAALPHLPRYTQFTIREPAELYEEIRIIRSRGYAISDQDYELGARGVGAPIFGADGQPVGGVSMGAPTVRMTLEEVETILAPLVLRAAATISRSLGFAGSWRDLVPA